MRRRWNKYNARKTKCAQGVTHDSGQEAAYCDQLHVLARDANSWGDGSMRPAKIDHWPSVYLGEGIRWRVDFRVTRRDGSSYLAEVKGYEGEGYRLKLRIYRNMLNAETVTEPIVIVKGRRSKSGRWTWQEKWYKKES